MARAQAVIWHDAPVKRRPLLAAVTAAVLIAAGVAFATVGARPARHDRRVSVTVGSEPEGRPLAPGFVGLSVEYPALPAYAEPLPIRLIRDLSPGQRPVLRIGGNSTDRTWWPQRGETPPRNARYALTPAWLQSAKALAVALHPRMIIGLNLAGGRPEVALDEARALLSGIGREYIEAFEIGNEPDVYGLFPWYLDRSGRAVYARAHDYSLGEFISEFSRWRAALGGEVPPAGPAFATFDWTDRLGRFIAAEAGLAIVTLHRYPLRACVTSPTAVGYPTVSGLLSDQSSAGFAQSMAPEVAVAHRYGLLFRLDEFNSVSCSGKWGVSNTFASALWMLDTLFELARVGVDGVNVHTFPGAAYAPFSATHVYPEYYGMLMFSRAFPAGARLLPVTVTPRGSLKAWATTGPGRAVRVVLINEEPHRRYQVQVHARDLSGRVRLERLLGGSSTAAADVITVPAASAVLLAMS